MGLLLVTGCAGGEGHDESSASVPFVREEPVEGSVFIEVTTPDGTPLNPESVEITIDGGDPIPATCMDEQHQCTVWTADFEALQRISVWASACQHRFGSVVALGPDVDESEYFEAAVTVIAVPGLCNAAEPSP